MGRSVRSWDKYEHIKESRKYYLYRHRAYWMVLVGIVYAVAARTGKAAMGALLRKRGK